MKNNNTEWKVKDKASHPTYGLVEIFEIATELEFANVFPVDEEKWGTSARMVNISDLQRPYEFLVDKSTTLIPNPKPIGGYDITGSKTVAGSIRFNFPKKPNWFHRMCCRFFLGWKWVDEDKQN